MTKDNVRIKKNAQGQTEVYIGSRRIETVQNIRLDIARGGFASCILQLPLGASDIPEIAATDLSVTFDIVDAATAIPQLEELIRKLKEKLAAQAPAAQAKPVEPAGPAEEASG